MAKQVEGRFQELHLAVQQTADAVVITDRRGVIQFVNPAFERMTGFSRADALGQTPRIVKSGAHDQAHYKRLWRTILSGEPFRSTFLNKKKSGERFYIDQTITPIKNTAGDVTHFVSTWKDVTAQKRAEEKLQRAHDQMRRDLDVAVRIQASLLPTAPPDVPGVSFAWEFEPCDQLSGDTLDVFSLDDRHVGVYLLDVSGHGVPAALLSMTVNRVLSGRASQDFMLKEHAGGSRYRLLPPSKVAEQLNKQFPVDPATWQYFTLLYGILDVAAGEFRYMSAGHPGPIHQSHGAATTPLPAHGFPIGLFEGATYEEWRVHLSPGDRLYVYSDGVIEATNEQDEQFGTERLIKVIDQHRHVPLKEGLGMLVACVNAWRGTAPRTDDVSVLGLEISR
jgi:sigma-B regulation protein RsbU (phosphoserine phosphatase)